MKKSYLFWYKAEQTAPTEYLYVIAFTLKQAKYFWFNYLKNTLGYAWDYDLNPVDIIEEKDFVKQHDAGEILGQYAVI